MMFSHLYIRVLLGILALALGTACQTAPTLANAGAPSQIRPWTQDAIAIPGALADDMVSVYTDPWNWAWLGVGTGLAFAAETGTIERGVESFVQSKSILDHESHEILATAGEGTWLFLLAGGAYFAAQLAENELLYHNSKRAMRALAVTGISTLGMKFAVGDPRPGSGGTMGFPSGHSSMSMAMATSVYESYGWKAGVPAVMLSLGVGLQRVEARAHDLDDVLFGWTLGFMVAHSIYQDEPVEVLGMTLTPFVDPEISGFGIGLLKTF
ncbi:MAG: phosphatase PAP2 family protein [Planctomycetes bacterium]|nr:phosphatase PAP2 family protein [Planctomycetota bacterium]